VSGVEISHDFIVENPTDVPVEVTRIRTSCGCTAGKMLPEVVPAHGRGTLHVVFKTGHRTGAQRKHIFISTRHPDASLLRCSIEGMLLAKNDPAATGKVAPARALDVPGTAAGDHRNEESPEAPSDHGGGDAHRPAPAARATESTRKTVQAAKRLNVAANPKALLFLSLPVGGSATRTITLREATGQPFEPVRATSGCANISWRFEPLAEDHTVWRAIATCEGGAAARRFRCQARILLATGESISLFVSGTTVAAP
jgi:hypothetical protein